MTIFQTSNLAWNVQPQVQRGEKKKLFLFAFGVRVVLVVWVLRKRVRYNDVFLTSRGKGHFSLESDF